MQSTLNAHEWGVVSSALVEASDHPTVFVSVCLHCAVHVSVYTVTHILAHKLPLIQPTQDLSTKILVPCIELCKVMLCMVGTCVAFLICV